MTTMVALGMAKKQASSVLNNHHFALIDDYGVSYKALVRKFMEWNLEIDKEYQEIKIVVGKEDATSILKTPLTPDTNVASSPNKACPVCNAIIPSNWGNHYKCGWGGNNANNSK